jgi:hypothetical protein
MPRSFHSLTVACAAIVLAGIQIVPSLAHHGWSWTESKLFQLEGVITKTYVGNPHATLDVDVAGTIWRVELAPPGPTAATGFTEELAPPGTEVTAIGNRSADPDETRMKAVRIIIGGQRYDLYPSRAQGI